MWRKIGEVRPEADIGVYEEGSILSDASESPEFRCVSFPSRDGVDVEVFFEDYDEGWLRVSTLDEGIDIHSWAEDEDPFMDRDDVRIAFNYNDETYYIERWYSA